MRYTVSKKTEGGRNRVAVHFNMLKPCLTAMSREASRNTKQRAVWRLRKPEPDIRHSYEEESSDEEEWNIPNHQTVIPRVSPRGPLQPAMVGSFPYGSRSSAPPHLDESLTAQGSLEGGSNSEFDGDSRPSEPRQEGRPTRNCLTRNI